MITEQQQEQASLYALGALPESDRRAFEAELAGDAELRELVNSLSRSASLLALASPQFAPSLSLRERVLGRVEKAGLSPLGSCKGPQTAAADVSRRTLFQQKLAPTVVGGYAAPGFHFVGAADPKGWKELPVRGAWIKLLSLERERGYAVLMGRLEAGVRYPAHSHPGAEELLILSGDLHLGDRALGPGDFHHADAGTSHGVNYSVAGCTLLAVLPADHELVQFATE